MTNHCVRLWLTGVFGLLMMCTVAGLHAFTVFPFNHQNVTISALSQDSFYFILPNGALVKFSEDAMWNIVGGNVAIDILSLSSEFYAENYHFDDERFSIGQNILLSTRHQIILQLTDPVFLTPKTNLDWQNELTLSSRKLLGNALHTLQDYYSHSNWVERKLHEGTLDINRSLGAKGKSLPEPVEGNCDQTNPGVHPLTTGDYFASGITDCTSICNARPNKCAHGDVGLGLCGTNSCGINKDHFTRNNFIEATDLARLHTDFFVAEIFKEALNDARTNKLFVGLEQSVALAICQLMGVPNPLSTCVTSHTVTVQKLNNANGQLTLEGLVESSGNTITPAINCGLLCEGTAIAGTTVVLTAKDILNWKFVRWAEGGACAASTDRECSFMVDSNKTARAEFNDEFAFEVAESYIPWDSQYPRLNCVHYEGEYQITGYYASFDRCYSNMDAVIRCVGAGCSASRFKVALIKVFWSGTVVGGGADCNSYQDYLGPGSGQIYPDSPGWHELGQGWTRTGFTSELSPLVNGSFVFQNFRWIGADPGVPCSGNGIKTMEVEFNVYDVATGNYTVIPFVMTVP